MLLFTRCLHPFIWFSGIQNVPSNFIFKLFNRQHVRTSCRALCRDKLSSTAKVASSHTMAALLCLRFFVFDRLCPKVATPFQHTGPISEVHVQPSPTAIPNRRRGLAPSNPSLPQLKELCTILPLTAPKIKLHILQNEMVRWFLIFSSRETLLRSIELNVSLLTGSDSFKWRDTGFSQSSSRITTFS